MKKTQQICMFASKVILLVVVPSISIEWNDFFFVFSALLYDEIDLVWVVWWHRAIDYGR